MEPNETAAEQQMSALVRRHASRYTAPPGLAARIGDALQNDAPANVAAMRLRAAQPTSPWRSFAMAACLLLAVGLSSGTTWYFAASEQQDVVAQQVVASHVRSMLGDHLTDVASSDHHTVKPWFGGKLDLSPPVVDLTTQGFPLVGGRLDYLDRRPVAALVYRHNQHVINVFVWPEQGVAVPRATPAALQGYQLRHWRQGDLTFWAVSDLNPTELDGFEKILRAATQE
jgi:anti-sigma factor RsiW